MKKCKYCVGGVVNKLTPDATGNYSSTREICNECNGTGYIKQTNADKIRSMSDEELSEYICGIIDIGKDKFINGITIPNYDENSIYEWLQSEVENGN